jgi:hypothetical protein
MDYRLALAIVAVLGLILTARLWAQPSWYGRPERLAEV